jgi:hypothetical protein
MSGVYKNIYGAGEGRNKLEILLKHIFGRYPVRVSAARLAILTVVFVILQSHQGNEE